MKLCKDCKYCLKRPNNSLWIEGDWNRRIFYCNCENAPHDIIVGLPQSECVELRHNEELCGKEAKWWKIKDGVENNG